VEHGLCGVVVVLGVGEAVLAFTRYTPAVPILTCYFFGLVLQRPLVAMHCSIVALQHHVVAFAILHELL
jgi:hypothetical protein